MHAITTRLAASALVLLAVSLPAQAQQNGVLKGADVTESKLIEALDIGPPAAAASGDARTRGFGQIRRDERPRPANVGKANLLITFETNSAELTAESRQTLDVVARALKSDSLAGFTFRVEGHADTRGDQDHNLQLSQLRAESVLSYLVNQHGILPERLVAQGKGSTEPMNRQRADAPENRRVTIVTNR